MGNVNEQFFLSSLIILIGYLVKRFNIINETEGQALIKLLFNVTLPALIINVFSKMKLDSSMVFLPVICIIYGLFMAFMGVYSFRKEHRSNRGMLTMLIPGFNVGLFAYPFVEAILGVDALSYLGMFDVGAPFIAFGVVYLIGSYFSSLENSQPNYKRMVTQLLKTVPFVFYIVAFIINIAGVHYPSFILDIASIIAKANMPLTLLILGVYLNFSMIGDNWNKILKIVALRYGFGLAVGTILYFVLPFNLIFRQIILICMVLPPPLIVISYAVEFDYDYRFVGALLNITNITSYILLWIIFNIMTQI